TVGNRRATQFIPLNGFTAEGLGRLAALASIADQTPEGKSIVELFDRMPGGMAGSPRAATPHTVVPQGAPFVEFPAQTRMSGIDLPGGQSIRKGAPDSIVRHIQQSHGLLPERLQSQVDDVASRGATPLLVAEGNKLAGLIVLEDVLKPGMRDRFERLRR